MNELPKMFCITLKTTPERKKFADDHFKQNGLDVTFFDGIDNRKFGLKTTIPYNDDNPNGPDYFIRRGHVGAILSHYMLWQTLSHLPYEEILIFEDDVVLKDNFKENLLNYKSQLPVDWQFVFVGHCCLPPEEYQIKLTDNIITTTHPPMCVHAYMIKKSSIPTLLDTNHIGWSSIDIQIQKITLKKMSHHIFLPMLADQRSITRARNQLDDPDNIFGSLTEYV